MSTRNNVKVLDKYKPRRTISDLDTGEMFRYPMSSDPSNIYMKVLNGINTSAVLLSTGVFYNDFNVDKDIEVINGVSIVR